MDQTQLHRYMEDHLAGSDGALAIVTRRARRHPGTVIEQVMRRLEDDIRRERAIVSALLELVDAPADPVRRATGMVAALGRMAASLPFLPEPSLLEDLEALAVGVWGKRLLWGALARVQEAEHGFEGVDLDELSERTMEQERVLLELRQEAIVEVLDLAA